MIYPNNFEAKLGFDTIRKLLKQHCLSSLGHEHVDQMHFQTNAQQINTQLAQIEEFGHILLFGQDFPTNYYIDLRESLHKIEIEGTFLSQTELFDLKKSLSTIKDLANFFKKTDEELYPELKKLTNELNLYPFIYQKIDSILDQHGDIKDKASRELAQIRHQLSTKRNAISKKVHQVLKKARENGIIDNDTEITIRDGKMLIPVSATNKRKIQGFIYDQSASGKTFFIEPNESIELDNEIRELTFEEHREIVKILSNFTAEIRPYLPDLLIAYDVLGLIDFIRAKALYAQDIEAIRPTVLENKPHLKWFLAKHPGLYLSLKKEKKEVVAQDLFFTENNRIILISGPNAGGKSVLLKTVGLLQYMLQCGLHISVGHGSETGIFKGIFIDIGDEQSIESDLSTYSSHLYNMKFFLKNANNDTIVLIDEFGTGTEPLLGGAIAESVLEKLNRQKTFGIITTHYTNLKHFAGTSKGIVNGAMLFDLNKLEPLYKLKVGKPGSSFAFEIAGKIGLPRDILDNASEKIGEDNVNFDKNLKAIERDRNYYQEKRKSIRLQEKKLEEKLSKFDKQLESTLSDKKKIIDEAKKEANELLQNVNRKIENTIFEIRQSQAEKEKTKGLRKNLDAFKQKTEKKLLDDESAIERKIEKIKQKQANVLAKKKKTQNIESNPEPIVEEKALEVGDTVKIYGQNSTGIIEKIKNNSAFVNFGNIRAHISIETLEKIKKDPKKNKTSNSNSFRQFDISKTKSDFAFGLDVRGKRTEEAIHTVSKYMDEVIISQVSEVKILHGTGNGILRQFIRDYLKTVDFVVSFKDEKIEAGGSGITVVNLKYN